MLLRKPIILDVGKNLLVTLGKSGVMSSIEKVLVEVIEL